jgi:hypothetical protein
MKSKQETMRQLGLLFEFAPPQELKKSINYVFMQYLILSASEKPPNNSKELYEHIYFLMDFLDEVEEG